MTKRHFAVAAAALLVPAGLVTASPAQAQEGAGVSFLGHFCGADNVGPEPTCTYPTTVATGYEGIGPFTITTTDADGNVVTIADCAALAQCGTGLTTPIAAGTTITVTVSAEPGDVGLGGI